jgi:UDP-N-acetylmuramoyl-tripeptide--D-alanyl-D-alanine ligase
MLKVLFPYTLHLNILQLEEYKINRFLRWIYSNFFTRKVANKKPLVWTPKIKIIFYLALIYLFLDVVLLSHFFGKFGFVLAVIFATQSYLYLSLATLSLIPYEKYNRTKTKNNVRKKIREFKKNGLQVVGITGSYGKTSVKEFLYQILRSQYKVLRTPGSYNTVFGISKVVDLELYEGYDFFICEMGAYVIGEIKELCEMVEPDHSILTGINEQHLERFGKIENTVKAKFELAQNTNKNGFALVNGENDLIVQNYSRFRPDAKIYKRESFATTLVGKANLENISAAVSMARLLGVTEENIITVVKNLKSIEHRLEVKMLQNGLTIIDDAYSSNVTGFKEALDVLSSFSDKQKIIATPGIVELGNKNDDMHKQLGAYAETICDKIILVGQSERTRALYNGVTDKSKVMFIDSLQSVFEHIPDMENSLLLIENDLPDNY